MAEIRTAELADQAGVSRQMIGKWAREGLKDVAHIRHGWWDADAALTWIAERRGDQLAVAGGPELTAARTRLTNLQADGHELKNQRERGESAYLDDMEAAIMELFAAMREVGDRECARGTAQEQAWKRELWHKICRHLSVDIRDLVTARARGEDSRAAALQDA